MCMPVRPRGGDGLAPEIATSAGGQDQQAP